MTAPAQFAKRSKFGALIPYNNVATPGPTRSYAVLCHFYTLRYENAFTQKIKNNNNDVNAVVALFTFKISGS